MDDYGWDYDGSDLACAMVIIGFVLIMVMLRITGVI